MNTFWKKTARSNLRTCRVSSLYGREWTHPLHVLAVQFRGVDSCDWYNNLRTIIHKSQPNSSITLTFWSDHHCRQVQLLSCLYAMSAPQCYIFPVCYIVPHHISPQFAHFLRGPHVVHHSLGPPDPPLWNDISIGSAVFFGVHTQYQRTDRIATALDRYEEVAYAMELVQQHNNWNRFYRFDALPVSQLTVRRMELNVLMPVWEWL